MICEKHGEYAQQEITVGSLTIKTGCPLCIRDMEAKEAAEAEAAKDAAMIARYKRQNIEPMYYDATLDTLEILTPEHEQAVKYAREMIRTKSGKLVMIGSNGTGKTHIAVSVVKELGGAVYSVYEIATRIRASYVTGLSEIEIVDELARLPMLAIDEIGRTKGSEAETNWLSYIIDKRHVRGIPLILISNKHTRKSCKEGGCEKCLENYLAEDVMSRLSEDAQLVNFSGEDYRRRKRVQVQR